MTAEWAARLVASPIMDGVIGSMRRAIAARQRIVAACLPERSLITRSDSFNVWMKLTNGWSSEGFRPRRKGASLTRDPETVIRGDAGIAAP